MIHNRICRGRTYPWWLHSHSFPAVQRPYMSFERFANKSEQAYKDSDRNARGVNRRKGHAISSKNLQALHSELSEVNISIMLILALIRFLFMYKIRFPNDHRLRLDFSIFLFDTMGLKQQALEELTHVERSSPALQYQFFVFRQK
jgi:hypothetical protein